MSSVGTKKQGRLGVLAQSIGGLWRRRWLIGYFIQRDVANTYKGSYLGYFWTFVNPLFMIVLYTFVFSSILDLRFTEEGGSVNFGVYLYCGLIPYLAFSEAVQRSLLTIKTNANLVQKVVFPIEILPLTAVATNFVMQLFGLVGLILVYGFLEWQLHWTIFLLPLIMVPQLLLTLGFSYMASVLGTFVPDMREIVAMILRALLFAVPILYPRNIIPEKYLLLVDLNPLGFLVAAYRDFLLNGEIPAAGSLFLFVLASLAIFALGLLLFERNKRKFADVL